MQLIPDEETKTRKEKTSLTVCCDCIHQDKYGCNEKSGMCYNGTCFEDRENKIKPEGYVK